jgi:hypothetical protein
MKTVTEKKFLGEEEIEKLQSIQEKTNAIILELGEIELVKLQIDTRYSEAKSFLKNLTIEEKEFTDSLSEKYGNVSINPKNGEISNID